MALVALLALALAQPSAAAPVGSTFLVSRPDGTGPLTRPTDNESEGPLAVSPDGRYVAFLSTADGFAPGADPAVLNLFLRDTRTKTTTLVNRSDGVNGTGANADVARSSRDTIDIAVVPGGLAAEGPHDVPHVMVVFATSATNLVDHVDGAVPATDGAQEVWLRDVTAGTTYLVSRAPSLKGAPADRRSAHPSIAVGQKGPLVAFESEARNLGEFGLEPPVDNVYVRDMEAGKTLLVSCTLRICGGSTSLGPSSEPSLIYADTSSEPLNWVMCPGGARCALVAFTTADPSIAQSEDADLRHTQVVLGRAFERGDNASLAKFDLWTTVSIRSRAPFVVGNESSWEPSLSAGLNVVGFRSTATNLDLQRSVPENVVEGYGHDLRGTDVQAPDQTRVATLAPEPRGAGVVPVNSDVTHLAVGGGRTSRVFVGFDTMATNVQVPGPLNFFTRAYSSNWKDDATLLDRGSGAGPIGDSSSFDTTISEGAPAVAVFVSGSGNLGAGGGSEFRRVYRRVIEAGGPDPLGSLELISRPSGTGPFSPGAMNSSIVPSATSADGRFVAFQSDADNLSNVDDDRLENVFVRDTVKGTTTLVSRANGANGAAADANSELRGISEDGQRILFTTGAHNLGAGGEHASLAYVRDIRAQTTTLASRLNGPTGVPASVASGSSLSGDGNRVAFITGRVLDPEAANGVSGHLYVRDLAQQTTTFVDRDDGVTGAAAELPAEDSALDRKGDRVAWTTGAPLLEAPVEKSPRRRIYLRDLDAGTTVLVSRADGAGGAEANGESIAPALNAAGNVVAFESEATNLGPVSGRSIWVRRIGAGRTELVSRASGASGSPADLPAVHPSIDAAGDRVAFISTARNLGAVSPEGDGVKPPPAPQAYVRDLNAKTTELVSRVNGVGGAPASPASFGAASISASGDCVAFAGTGTNYTDALSGADFPQVRERVLRGDCGPAAVPSNGLPVAEPQTSPVVLSHAAARPPRFYVGRSGGTDLSFVLSAPSRVTISFRRLRAAGSISTFAKREAGRLVVQGRQGPNTVHFTGRVHGRVLAPGTYRWEARTEDGHRASGRFAIVRRPAVRRHAAK
jgi:WD40-like Beta Propeller Repeat